MTDVCDVASTRLVSQIGLLDLEAGVWRLRSMAYRPSASGGNHAYKVGYSASANERT